MGPAISTNIASSIWFHISKAREKQKAPQKHTLNAMSWVIYIFYIKKNFNNMMRRRLQIDRRTSSHLYKSKNNRERGGENYH